MAHAFRSAAHIEADAAQHKIDRLRERWASTRDTWFDGTPDAVDRRLGWLDEVIATARSTASRLHASQTGAYAMSLLPQLRADREQLLAVRDRLAGWFPGNESEAMGHNLDPRDYSSRGEWMDANNMRGYIDHSHQDNPRADWDSQAGDYAVPPVGQDMAHGQGPLTHELHHAAAEFIESQNTRDPQELLGRAQRLLEARTSTWSTESSNRTVRAFVAAVGEQIPRRTRVAAQQHAAVVEDFEDHLMFS